METIQLPVALIEQIRNGEVILFLGAGASRDAFHKDNKQPPIGQQLADVLVDRFLGDDYKGRTLSQVAELAISVTDLVTVQTFVAEQYKDFYPSDFHKIIPRISWKAIATTNYDLIVERAYDAVPGRLQQAVAIIKDGEHFEHKLRDAKSIPYLKLHGCVTNIEDALLPLILTPDQYVTHRQSRQRLFEKLANYAKEYPILFVGYTIADSDIRQILLEITQSSDARPRSYLIDPRLKDLDADYWKSRKITCFKATFKEFLEGVDAQLGSIRGLSTVTPSDIHPIQNRFSAGVSQVPTTSLLTMLDRDTEYIYKAFPTKRADSKLFYKGFVSGWDAIEMGLDVKRSMVDHILSEVFLTSESEKGTKQELFVIKGHAGSGKSVLVRRIAWDAAREWDRLCLWVKTASTLEYAPLLELYTRCKERIFLFIDSAADNQDTILSLMSDARQDKLPLTIITSERHNEWNSYCDRLNNYVTTSYDIKYLSKKEIEELVTLLTKHKSLGHLEGMTFEAQVEQLESRAGRQLLVALHEATLGKPFADIVYDEYQSIPSPQAQRLYLTVCILHRLDVMTRAGVIARIHDIPFSKFEENLFHPLEGVVFAAKNTVIDDYEYRTRHSYIADIVFERVLVSPQDRFDEYVKILHSLDVDYNSDREAFIRMTNAKELRALFSDVDMIRQIYEIAFIRSPQDPMLMQQCAIFEMRLGEEGFARADELLQEAYRLAPWYAPIQHSLAGLSIEKSKVSKGELDKRKYREEAKTMAKQMLSRKDTSSHPYNTLIRVGMDELEEIFASGDEVAADRKIKELEEVISKAFQTSPDDEFVLGAESRFNRLIGNYPQALQSLEKAFFSNKRSPYIAIRLSNSYSAAGNADKAVQILRECLEHNVRDKEVNFRLAMMLMEQPVPNFTDVRHLLRNSFTKGDARHKAQFWYARLAYIDGNFEEAREIFSFLRDVPLDGKIKHEPYGRVENNGMPVIFHGTLEKKEYSHAFIKRDGTNDTIYARWEHNQENWQSLDTRRRVCFDLCFNYRGPLAVALRAEK